MRKIYLIAGHNGPGTGATGHIDEGAETIVLRDLIAKALEQNHGITAIVDPPKEKLSTVAAWLKRVLHRRDICVDIHFNSSSNSMATGVEVLVSKEGDIESSLAKDLRTITVRHLGIRDRGTKPESSGAHSRLAMLSNFECEQIIWEVCFVSNQEDAYRYKTQKAALAMDVAKILAFYAVE